MNIPLIKEIHFPEGVSMLGVSAAHRQFIVEDNSNSHYILDESFEVISRFETPYARRTLSVIHPTEPRVAIMGKDNLLHITDLGGIDLWTTPGEYLAACWSLDGAVLYTLLSIDPETRQLIVYDNTGVVMAEKTFADELYDSSALISVIPGRSEMVLELMAGQDGCTIIFVSLDGGSLALKPINDLYAYVGASFNDSGTRFLCIDADSSEIHHFSYPQLEEIGVCRLNAEDCNLDYTLIHLDNQAIIRYGELFHMLDTRKMALAEDFIIEGHEPVPTCEIYPRLADDHQLICDISYLCNMGGSIVGAGDRDDLHSFIVIDKNAIK